MIPLQFVLFWAGDKLPYLRYLTFKSLRHFHPEAGIELVLSKAYNKSVHSWGVERQDFETKFGGKDYFDKLDSLRVFVTDVGSIGGSEYCPIYQADMFRWEWLRQNGGFYLDTDQVVLKPFDSLPLDSEFIYCRYMERQCGDYLPIGVLGMEKGSNIATWASYFTRTLYSPRNYNSSGPFMMREAIKHMDLSRSFNAPYEYFYPVNSSADVDRIYSGNIRISDDAYAIHWFGGHPLSQEFNRNYTEEFAKTSKDLLSVKLRENGII